MQQIKVDDFYIFFVYAQIWTTIMGMAEWNKKEELVTDQALKHLRQYTLMLQAFTTVDRAELALILKVQEFCYENMNFMKAFHKIMLLFYKGKFIIFIETCNV